MSLVVSWRGAVVVVAIVFMTPILHNRVSYVNAGHNANRQPGMGSASRRVTGRRRPGIVCGMDDTTETQLRAAQQKVDLAAAKLARAIVARDRIIKTTVAAGATRYAVAKVTGLTQPAVKKAVDRT